MKQTESLFDVLKCVIGRNDKDDADELQWGEYNDGSKTLDFDPCGDMPIDDSRWVLKGATDREARFILSDFVGNKTCCGWALNCQMARLLSERGFLIAKRIDKIIEETDWSRGVHSLLLAYLAVKPDGAILANKLLDIVPNDARDGLFLACWKIKDRKLQSKLLRKFEEWLTTDETWDCGDGEGAWLGRFVSKWLTSGTFTYARLEKCIRWYFKQQHRFL
jgi:hypothetical protein